MLFPSNLKKKTYLKGQLGEQFATLFLRLKGYEILQNRFKTPVGEIDILARKGNFLIAIEVKSRPTLEKASLALAPFQKKRIERAFLYYLSYHPSPLDLRLDVILISPWRWPCHIQGAWISQ